ncbi:hypothetical protein BJY00DRAFT_280454 [Aspergillus carlsbadensis]|nr:hypothetical protein BJY00DRAFT_280454 [Aspergillus carlsbadensis]
MVILHALRLLVPAATVFVFRLIRQRRFYRDLVRTTLTQHSIFNHKMIVGSSISQANPTLRSAK